MIPTLSAEQIEKIHDATLYVLEEKGIQVTHPNMQRIAKKHGAEIKDDRIRIPRQLLDELLTAVPASFDIGDIAGRCSNVGNGSRHCHAIVTDPWIIDCPSGTPRRPVMDDLIRNTVLGQKLDKIVAMSCMDFPVADVSGEDSNLRALEQHLLHHNKHNFIFAAGEDGLSRWKKLIELYNSNSNCGAPLFSMAAALISPLIISDFNIDIIFTACGYGFPIIPTICPMAGTTSPYSRYGTLLQGNIENIAMAALVQMIKPGQPIFYVQGPSVTDLSNGNSLYYTLDKVTWKSAAVELAKSYRIPVLSASGGTMTSHFDQQNGMEGILFMLASVISGADFLTGFGSCYNAVGMAPEMTVIHDAWFDAVQFLQQKIDSSQADMALDSIMRIGEEQHFLADDLTLENMHSREFFQNDLFDFSGSMKDSVPMLEKAHEKVMKLTAEKSIVLPGKLAEQIQRFFKDE
jgi:trimethylamine--corrinoid protein Co-methyltransferase